jgi:hypothetical protein
VIQDDMGYVYLYLVHDCVVLQVNRKYFLDCRERTQDDIGYVYLYLVHDCVVLNRKHLLDCRERCVFPHAMKLS